MKALFAALFISLLLIARPALSQQDVVWVQVEAQPSLSLAQDAARRYSATLPDVNGFALGGGWYGVLLGPYLQSDAERVLQVYRRDGEIPADSYIQFTSQLGRQFWPVGSNILGGAPVTPQVGEETASSGILQPETQVENEPRIQDETPAEARRSEAALTRDERRALQIALQWAGFYNSAIDGAFGRGTRGSMSAWQINRGYQETGVLTTAQRAELLAEYNAPLTSVGMQMLSDDQAGIELMMPMGEVSFARYEPPFVHFDSSGDLGAKVLLISQPGTRDTLFGLYEIMQTLEIVPVEGRRERGEDSFVLIGQDNDIVSYTQAALENGHIKGFTLVWPAGDEERRTRVLSEMRNSFALTDAVLDPTAGGETVQSIDLISGLAVRKPRFSRSGFFIDDQGTVVTTSEVLDGCARLTLEGDITAELISEDRALGVAILRPAAPLAPMSVARFRVSTPRLQSDVAVSGYSYEGVLGAPTLTFGTLSDIKGLRGETELKRLALSSLPGDAGGPVIDSGGTVVGMLLPRGSSGQKLPVNVSFAANASAINNVLADAGLSVESIDPTEAVTPLELDRLASGMTVLVSCWD